MYIDGENTTDTKKTTITVKEPKPKKERKKKEKVPKVIGGKRSSLSGLLGLKVGKTKKKPKDFTSVLIPVTDTDNDSRGKNLLTSLKSKGTDNDILKKETSFREHKNRELTEAEKIRAYGTMKNKSTSNLQRPPNNLTKMQYRPQSSNVIKPQTPNTIRPSTSQDIKTVFGNYKTEDVKANITKILEYRRQREVHEKMMNQREMQQKLLIQNKPQTPPRKPAIIRPHSLPQTNISPKTVAIPEIPKSYINKEQTEKLAELMRAQREQLLKNSAIQYANTNCANKTNELMDSSKSQQSHASTLKMTDIVNTSYDRLMAEISERHKGLQITKPSQMQHRSPHYSMPAQKSYSIMTPGQRDFQKFLKEYEQKKYSNLSARPTNVSAKSATKTVKKPMPMSRVLPVIPNVPKVDLKPVQVVKQPVQPKKPDTSLNTFSRLSYMHKYKQNEAKINIPTQKPCNTSTYHEISSELDEIIKEHQQAKMRVIQTKKENVNRLQKPANAQEIIKKRDSAHPFLSDLLSSQPSLNMSLNQNESSLNNSAPVQQMSSVTPNTSLSDKDHNDLLNLLRQQSKLNNSPQSKLTNSPEKKIKNSTQSNLHNSPQSKFINSLQSKLYNSPKSQFSNSAVQYATNIRDKPSTSTISKTESLTDSTVDQTQQSKQNRASKTVMYEKRCKSMIETKINNILSNTSLKSGNHEVNEHLSVNVKPIEASISTEKVAEPIGKKHTAGKNQKPKSKDSEWKSVMCDILKHKTPCRGPNALDVALNKSSFESAFQKSLKEATSLSYNSLELETDTSIKPQEKVVRSKPVITSIQNVIITKKGIKVQDATKLQQNASELKNHLKHSFVDEKLKKESISEPASELLHDTQRKQFTYAGPKHDDPFISGIPNSDYDLLEELMDDDLRKEIGELSSDEESYNTVAQTFLKPPKSNENKRVSVEFNKGVDEITSGKPLSNMPCVKNLQSSNDMMQAVTLQPASQCTNNSAPRTHGTITLQRNVDYTSVHNIIPSCQSTPTNISATSNIHNQAYNNVNALNNSQLLMNSQNIYISSVPQTAPVQNVVLVGPEIVYGGYSAVQTPVQSVSALTPNAYLVNNAPTMTYMTQYAAPVIIETSISVPAINNIACAAVSDQVNMISNVPQPTYASVNLEPQTSTAGTQMSSVISTETNNVSQNSDYYQKNYKLQDENKATERKVLSEVQDFASTEKIDNLQNLIENEISMNKMRDATVNNERLKTKRLAIINRKIYHQCLEQTIPLSYSPLLKVQTVLNEYDISKASPVDFTPSLLKDDKQMLSDSEEEKLLAQIKNNLQDLSDAINEVPSPATPDSTESKENKSIPVVSCRKIQLRSSTKITIENSASEISAPEKSKAKLESDMAEEPTKVINESDNKDVSGPKRASKRLHSKKSTITTEENKPTQIRIRKQSKQKPPPKNKRESKLKNKISIIDQSELQGSVISKSDIGSEITYGVEKRDIASESSKAEKIGAFEYITQTELDNKKVAETVNDMQMDEDSVRKVLLKNTDYSVAEPSVEGLGDDEQFPGINIGLTGPTSNVDDKIDVPETVDTTKNKLIDSTNEKLSTNKVRNDVDKKFSDSECDFNDGIRVLSELPPIKLHKYKSELLSETTVSKEVQTVSVPVAESLPENDKIERFENISKAIENTTSQDRNRDDEKHNIAAIQDQSKGDEKDNVDLDMTVTCDEVTIPNLSPTFGNIKMARSKPINSEQNSNVKVLNDTIAIHDEIKPTQKFKYSEKIKPDEEKIVLVDPRDSKFSHLEINSTIQNVSLKSVPERFMKKPQTRSDTKYFKTHTIDNVPKNMSDDVVIIDDEAITATELLILKHDSNIPVANKSNHKTSLAECNNDCLTIQSSFPFKEAFPPKEDSNEKNSKTIQTSNCSPLLCNKTSLTDHYINNAQQLKSLSTSNYNKNTRKETNMDVKSSNQIKQSNVLHVDSQNEKSKENSNDIKLSEIPQDYKDKIRIETLPSNDALKKNVRVSLPNGRKFKATVQGLPNTVEVQVTLDMLFAYPAIKSALLNGLDCKKLFTMNIKQIATVSTNEPIRILSQILNVETFAAESQKNMEPVETIDLLSDDEDLGPPKKPLTAPIEMNKLKLHTEFGMFTIPAIEKDIFIKHQKRFREKSQVLLEKVDPEPVITKMVPQLGDLTRIIPNQYVSGLINDIKNKLASDNKTTSKIISEVVEIDDSSNDSSYPVCVVPKEKNTIDDLKNVLLKELGVNDVKERFVNSQKKIPIVDENVEILTLKKSTRRNFDKLSTVPSGKSFPFDTLDEEEQLKIKRRKCAVMLIRCDGLVKVHEKEITQVVNDLLTPVFDNAPVAITEEFSLFDNLDEMVVEEEERSSSPVIELNEMIVSLNESPALSKHTDGHVTPLACEAHWLTTKLEIHSQSTNNVFSARNDFQSDADNLDDHMVCSKLPLSCSADWRSTKLTLHKQNMDKVLISANVIKFDDDMLEIRVAQVLPLSCEANWLSTKSTLHVENINKELLRVNVIKLDVDMLEIEFSKNMQLSCEANWLSTKSTLHINNTNKEIIHVNVIKNYEDTCNDSVSEDMPLSCDAYWLTTKSTLHSHILNKNLALPSARVFETDEETYVDIVDKEELKITLKKCFVDLIRCDDLLEIHNKEIADKSMQVQISIADEQIPLSCEADWLNTKPTLHLQGVENIKLVRSYPFVHSKETCDSSVQVIPHSCKATWFATKSTLHLQVIDAVQEKCNIAENREGILEHNVTSLSCKARWFVTKASIHSEAVHNTPFVRFNVFDYKPMLPQENDVPSLVSLVLDRLQAANVKHYYRYLRKTIARPILKSFKRKSSSLDKTPACKIPKQNDGSDYIIKNIKIVHDYDTSKSLVQATKCDDNHNMNSYDGQEKLVRQDDNCKSDENVQMNTIEDSFIANIKKDDNIHLSLSSEINCKAVVKINIDCVSESRSPSLVLETDPLLAYENHVSAIISCSSQSSYDVSSESKIHKNHITQENIKVCNKNYDDEEVKVTKNIAENVENRYMFQVDEDPKIVNLELIDHVGISNITKIKDNLINLDKQCTYSIDSNISENSQDHDYCTSHSATSGTELINENTYNQEIIYVSTDNVVFFSQDEEIQELEEEIVEMRSNEIIDDFVYDMTTFTTHDKKCTNPFIDCVDDIKTLKGKERNGEDNRTHLEDIVSPEENCKKASNSLVENGVGTSSDNGEEKENVTQLDNDASADSIITKYMKLIQNDSNDFQNVIEYEDPDTGTCYVIPIIRSSSQTDTAFIENTRESKVSKSSTIGDVNGDAINNCYQFIAPSESEDLKKDIAVSYDDIEAKLAQIVGEPLVDNLHEQTKVFASNKPICSSLPDVKDVVCQLKGSNNRDISNNNVTAKRQGNDDSSIRKKKRSKYKKNENVNNADIENFVLKMPKRTYSTGIEPIITRSKSSKRKIDMSDSKTSERKYRKAKNIDYPKFTSTSLSETVYQKEYKCLIDYCSSIKFSYSVPFQREHIDVLSTLKSWPIKEIRPQTTEEDVEDNWKLFVDIEKSEALLDPLNQTLTEEITGQFDENSYTPSNIKETNFNMGFGERSDRVIQELIDGEYTTFSAATLSDVKQLQPLLPSDKIGTVVRTNFVNNDFDQRLKAMRFVDHLHLRERVKAFFEKSKAELNLDWKDNHKNCVLKNDESDWPFGDFTSLKCFRPSPVELTVNVVQVGQLPVSAAAQNPVTCDPRVTHVSNASPSQCSPENNLADELQTPIKTEYTELTTADITLPVMQEYVQHHHPLPSESQEPTKVYSGNDSMTMTSTEIKSIVKIELLEEHSQADEDDTMNNENNGLQQVPNGNISNNVQYENVNNNVTLESGFNAEVVVNSSNMLRSVESFSENIQIAVEKSDQLAHAMNAAGIPAAKVFAKSKNFDTMPQLQHSRPNVTISQANTNNFPKTTTINAITLQQALAQILPPPLNPTNPSENNFQSTTNPQVLHIVQSNNTQSVINKPNGTQLLHIVQNKNSSNSNGAPAPQQTTFSGLSLVDGAIQQGGNQLLHLVNAANQKSANAGQLLKRVNLLTNLANVQGSNEQKMVQFVCKSTDGKPIQLPHQRSMVLRLQPLDTSTGPVTPKQSDNQDQNSSSGTSQLICEKESSPQDMKSRSSYEENYARFVQNDPKFAQNEDSKPGLEKSTSLPKFNQVFGKQVYQDNPDEMESENLPQNSGPQEENNTPLDDITNPPMLIRKTNQPQSSQPNMVQPIKQTIGPMNIQTMHGGVIYTRQIPVNIGNGQTISLITVPSTELVDDSAQKQSDGKFGNQEDPPIIKIAPTNQAVVTPSGSADDNISQIRSNETNPQPPNTQHQPVLTQMRIKLPMLSKAPQMVGGTRVVRPSFFQIHRNVIGGANQQVYQQLVLTAAPPLGQSIRLPAQGQKSRTSSDSQSSPESQMSSSTLEQLREFDMVLEQVKERSTVQPGSSLVNHFSKLKGSRDTTDSPTPSTSHQESLTQVLYSVGNSQPLNVVNFVSRKSTITSTGTSFARSPDSTGTVESPSSSTHSNLPHTVTSDSCASSSCASEAAVITTPQPKPKKKKPKPSTSNSNPFNIKNTPKPSSQKPLEDEQTTQRILYILAEYKEQVEKSPDKDKPAPRRRNNPAAPNAGSSKRKKSSCGSRRRDMSPVLGEDSCRTMGSEDSSCGTSLGECNDCSETHSPEESPKKVVRRLTFEQETQITQTRTTTTTTTTIPQRNVIVTDGQAFAVRGATGKPATTVLMPANYLLPVSMVKGGQQIAIVTNRGPKLLVGAGESGTGGTLLFQRLIGPGGLKPVLARPGVRHIRLPTAALHNLQAFNIATPASANVQPPDSTASPAPAATPPDLVDTRAMSSPWPDRDAGEVKPERGNSSPEGSEPWNLPSSSIAEDYGYEEIVRTDNMDRTVLVSFI